MAASAAAFIHDPAASALAEPSEPTTRLVAPPRGPEIKSERTRFSRTYAAGGAGRVTRFYTEPVNYRDRDGTWKAIDNLLSAKTSGPIVNAGNRYELELPRTLGPDRFVRVGEGSDWIRFSLWGASGRARVAGNDVTYDDAFPGVDLAYAAEDARVKETLTLADPSSGPGTYRFDLRLSRGMRARLQRDGSIAVRRDGRRQFTIAAPFMYDQDAGSHSDAIALALRRTSTGYALTMTPDRAWLTDPKRAYPVVIDPIVFLEAGRDCYVTGGTSATTSFCGTSQLKVGYDGAKASRALLNFDLAARIPPQSEILNAELGMYLRGRTTTAAAPVNVHQVTRSWSSGATTWLLADGAAAWSSAGGDYNPVVAATNRSVGGTTGQYYEWHATDLVQQWMDARAPNYGLLVKQESETVANVLTFDSRTGATKPYLDVWYEPRTGALARYEFDGDEPPEPILEEEAEPIDVPFRFDVNVANGNLLVQERDMLRENNGPDVVVTRYYNSLVDYWLADETATGNGWSLGQGHDVKLRTLWDKSVAWYGPSGFAKVFQRRTDGTFVTPPGLDATLVRNADGTYTLRLEDGERVYQFGSGGRLNSETDGDGAQLTYAYSLGNLASITDPSGGVTSFTYSGGLLTKMTEPGGAVHAYTHDGNGNLTTHQAASGATTRMYYDLKDNLTRIVDPTGTDYRFTYDSLRRVTSVTKVTEVAAGTGPTTRYVYGTSMTTVTAPDGIESKHTYDGMSIVRQSTTGSSPPQLTLSGALAAAEGGTLTADAPYALRADATDTGGVAAIHAAVDSGVDDEGEAQPCSGTSCTFNWTLYSDGYRAGETIIRVTARDAAGNEASRTLRVIIPPWRLTTDGLPLPTPPTVEERKQTARDFRTDLGLAVDAATIDSRDTDPAAQAAKDEWGVPLNAAELAELETRMKVQDDMTSIDAYVERTASAAAEFAGTYIDQDAGGLVYVGFTRNTSAHLAEISKTFPHASRLRGFTVTRTAASLDALTDRIADDVSVLSSEGINVYVVLPNLEANTVVVGVSSPDEATRQRLVARYGDGVDVRRADPPVDDELDRFKRYLRINAGLRLLREGATTGGCTAGYSATRKSLAGRTYFHLTAGHCQGSTWTQGGRRIGRTYQVEWKNHGYVDVQAIKASRYRTSNGIFGRQFRRTVTGVERTKGQEHVGQLVCKSGRVTDVTCGKLISVRAVYNAVINPGTKTIRRMRLASYHSLEGDSGAPVYRRLRYRTALASGMHKGRIGFDFGGLFRSYPLYSSASMTQRAMNLTICRRGYAQCGR